MSVRSTTTIGSGSLLPFMTSVIRGIDRLSEWQGKITSFLILVATLQVCYELVLRYAFNSPTTWGLELTLYLCATTYLMAGAYAEYHNAHIRVDIYYNRWSRRARAFFDLLVTDLLFFFFCGVLVWQSALWLAEAINQNLTSGSIWDPVIWPMRLVMLMGASFLWLAGFGKFLRDLLMAIFGKKID